MGLATDFRALAAGAVAVFAAATMAAPTTAWAAGLFSEMGGDWRGRGSIIYSSGQSEGMTCKATYEVMGDGNKITQDLTCAFASGGAPLKITSDITYRVAAGVINGRWREGSYGLSGSLMGRASRNKITAQVSTTSANLSVEVEVITNGGQQTVTLRPTGLDVREVRVNLSKR